MTSDGFDVGRLARLLVLITVVTAVFVLTAANRFEGQLLQVSIFAIGTVSVLTAIIGVLIAGSSAYTA